MTWRWFIAGVLACSLLGGISLMGVDRSPDELAAAMAVFMLVALLVTRTIGRVLLYAVSQGQPPPRKPSPGPPPLAVLLAFYGAAATLIGSMVALYIALLLLLTAMVLGGVSMSWAALGALRLAMQTVGVSGGLFLLFLGLAKVQAVALRQTAEPLRWAAHELGRFLGVARA